MQFHIQPRGRGIRQNCLLTHIQFSDLSREEWSAVFLPTWSVKRFWKSPLNTKLISPVGSVQVSLSCCKKSLKAAKSEKLSEVCLWFLEPKKPGLQAQRAEKPGRFLYKTQAPANRSAPRAPTKGLENICKCLVTHRRQTHGYRQRVTQPIGNTA